MGHTSFAAEENEIHRLGSLLKVTWEINEILNWTCNFKFQAKHLKQVTAMSFSQYFTEFNGFLFCS